MSLFGYVIFNFNKVSKIRFGLFITALPLSHLGWFWELRKSVLLQTKCVRHLFCPLCHHGCLRSHRGGFCFTDRQALRFVGWNYCLDEFSFLTKFDLPSRCFSTHGSRLLTHGGSATGRTSFLIIDTLFLTFLIFWSVQSNLLKSPFFLPKIPNHSTWSFTLYMFAFISAC